ncbi:2-oxoglutarate and iron-dependent oxygenase domain-containing protein [Plantactinospora sp. KBS50]|uniref:2-oxoglutarate and iron-dependent oxygenase domain-containing protein n=1 Tax=Plantactinospora sp. KBS50 TaxID=2024580 RepID=UPI0012FE2D2A|nr:2-oxoglutarate and iron-dependent oxygenase domain-containing protein [Plantactinospora sp. KBS50]
MHGLVAHDEGHVPVVDLGIAGSRSRALLAQTVAEICATAGFFVALGHGVLTDVVAAMDDATAAFFHQPTRDKLALLAEPGDPLARGLGRDGSLAGPNVSASAIDRAADDVLETYTMNRLGEPEHAEDLPARVDPVMRTPNKWPDLPGFRSAYTAYYAAMEQLQILNGQVRPMWSV